MDFWLTVYIFFYLARLVSYTRRRMMYDRTEPFLRLEVEIRETQDYIYKSLPVLKRYGVQE